MDSSQVKESTFDEQLARLKQAAGVDSDTALARSLGISQGSISAAKQKQQIPPSWVKSISNNFSVSADWLFFGEGSMRRSTTTAEPVGAGVPMQGAQVCDPAFIMVPKVEARLSAGNGSLLTSKEIDGYYAFKSEWLRKKGNPKTMVLVRVSGDSMSPEIEDEDNVLIDENQKDVLPGKKYAVGIDDEVYIKYIDRIPGKYILRSVNRQYAPIEVDMLDESRNVRIIGRMLWLARESR